MLRIKRIVSDFFGRGYLDYGIHFLVVEYAEPSRIYMTISIRGDDGEGQIFCVDGMDQIKTFGGYFKKLKRLEKFTFAASGVEDGQKLKYMIQGQPEADGKFVFIHTDHGVTQELKINKWDFDIFRGAMLRIENEIKKSDPNLTKREP